MLTSLNRMTGLPVMWREKQLGYVERAVVDLNSMRMEGVVVRRGIGSARWVSREGIMLVGKECVVLSRLPERMQGRQLPDVRRTFEGWNSSGMVSDVIVNGDTLCVAALEVSPGPIYRLLGRCAYAPCCRADGSREKEGIVLAPLLSWTQLLTRFGEGEDA